MADPFAAALANRADPPPAVRPRQWASPGELAAAVDPKTVQTPALDVIDEALIWAYRTRDARLIISIAPQEGKTTRAVQVGSLWALTDDPERRIGVVSYQKALAENSGRIVRNLISSFDGTDGALDLGLRIAPDNGAASRWQLDGRRGGMVCAGIGSGLTGKPLDVLVIDDPFADMIQAESEVFRERAWSWWTSVGSTRLAPGAPVIQIATRWHEADLAGKLTAAEDGHRWRVINIPALADHDPEKGQSDPLGRKPGEWLKSARGRTAEEWERIRIQAGSRVFGALYQGRPSPDQGGVWKRQWWRRYPAPLWTQHPTVAGAWLVDADEVLISVDCTFKDTKSSDFVVMQVWARRGAMAYLLDQVRKRLSFTDTITALLALVAKWPQASRKLVEDKANGSAVIDSLKSKVAGLVPVNPTNSKYGRATAVSPFIESGNVLLPEKGIGLFDPDELVNESAAFPNDAHDDQVDATSQALAEMFLDGTGAQAWLNWAKRKAEEAAAARGETPGAVPVADAAPGPDSGSVEDPLVSPGAEPGTWRVRSSDGQRDYVTGPDGRCPCQAGMHGKPCRHVGEAGAAGAESEAPLSPDEIRKRARDAAFRAQQGNWR